LFLGTQEDNNKDMKAKGRARGVSRPGSLAPVAKLSWSQVGKIRELYNNGEYNMTELGERYNVSSGTIHFIVSGRTWTDKDYTPPRCRRKHLSDSTVGFIRDDAGKGMSNLDIAKKYDVSVACVYNLVRGITYRGVP
jgi:hypothetical protein